MRFCHREGGISKNATNGHVWGGAQQITMDQFSSSRGAFSRRTESK